MSEQDLVNQIIEYLRLSGACAIRINSGVQVIQGAAGRRVFRGAPAGTSDIIACVNGRFLAVECKLEGNKPTPAQSDFLDGIRQRGGLAIVAYSLEDVINCLANA